MPSYILRDSLLREGAIKAMKVVAVQLEDILPPVTRTFLLMENAVMPAQSRISIMNLCSNVYTYDAVSRALRQSFGDKELMAMDQMAPRETFRHVGRV